MPRFPPGILPSIPPSPDNGAEQEDRRITSEIDEALGQNITSAIRRRG